MQPAAGSMRRCWGAGSTWQLQVEPHCTDWIYWTNGFLLHYIATLTQDWQGAELAKGGKC